MTTATEQRSYAQLPEHMRETARAYAEEGLPPGGFLTAILCNDLAAAASRADGVNQAALFDWANWLYSALPRSAWGSAENVLAWIEAHAAQREEERRD